MRIVSWNINSVRIRLQQIQNFCETQKPDILCLQETKVQDQQFPIDILKSFGFEYLCFRGEKSYNGVAILSKVPLTNVNKIDMVGTTDARHISAVLPNNIEIHNFYIPAGGDEPDIDINPKFKFKLEFLDYMEQWFRKNRQSSNKIIILGDFNIAPLEHDVWSSKQLKNTVSHTDIERKKLIQLMQDFNWIDTARKFIPQEEKTYSWWSYRNKDWKQSNRGRRLDHIWVTQPLASNLLSYQVIQDLRGCEKPSDHAPILLNLLPK
jgi:exodeoxyribonuclease-3